MEPNIGADAVAALWAPTGGIVCPYELTIAYAENAVRNGAVILRDTQIHPLLAFALALLITTAFGAAMGAIIHYLEMPPFIVTLAGMFLMRGMAYVITTESVPIEAPFYDWLQALSWKAPGGGMFRVTGFLMLGTFAVAMLVLHRTRFGQNIYAMGGSLQTAQLMGVPRARTTIGIYAVSGGLAGLAGWFLYGWIGTVAGALIGLPLGYWIETWLERR